MKSKESKVVITKKSSIGRYDKGTVVIVKGFPYILKEGHCETCDCGKDCFSKPFNCDKEVEYDLCLKKFKGGI